MLVVVMVLLLVFNTAQLTSAKMKLQNTADASAYSVATIAARDYNFSAYMNRAMVANQVSVAQMVGITSWLRFTGKTLDNIDMLCAPVPGLDAICHSARTAYDGIEKGFEASVLPLILKTLNVWLTALSTLQQAFHIGNAEAIMQNIFYSGDTLQPGVLAQNDPDAEMKLWPGPDFGKGDIPEELYKLGTVIKDAADWWRYTKRYEGKQAERFAEVTQASVDGFSTARSWDTPKARIADTEWIRKMVPFPKWLLDIIKTYDKAPGFKISASLDIGLKRRGGTELKKVADYYSWSAADTLMGVGTVTVTLKKVWWVPCLKHPLSGCKKTTTLGHYSFEADVPFGWGAAHSSSPGDSTAGEKIFHSGLNDRQYGGAAAGPARAAFEVALAHSDKPPLASFGGLQRYYDVSNPQAASTRNREGPQFTLVVSKKSAKVRTAARAGFGAANAGKGSFGAGNLGLAEPSADDVGALHVLAKGRLHFAHDKQFSHLFSPYWEAKLADTTNLERKLAFEALFGWKDWSNLLPGGASAVVGHYGLSVYAP